MWFIKGIKHHFNISICATCGRLSATRSVSLPEYSNSRRRKGQSFLPVRRTSSLHMLPRLLSLVHYEFSSSSTVEQGANLIRNIKMRLIHTVNFQTQVSLDMVYRYTKITQQSPTPASGASVQERIYALD